jgi:hypothetical protein
MSFIKPLSEESPTPQIINDMQTISDNLEATRRDLEQNERTTTQN